MGLYKIFIQTKISFVFIVIILSLLPISCFSSNESNAQETVPLNSTSTQTKELVSTPEPPVPTSPITPTPIPAPILQGTISYEDTKKGSISVSDQLHQWTFSGKKGDIITLNINTENDSNLNPIFWLTSTTTFDRINNIAISATTSYSNNVIKAENNTIENIMLRKNDIHSIIVAGEEGSNGNYEITLNLVNQDTGGGLILFETPTSGIIETYDDIDEWTFSSEKGSIISIETTIPPESNLTPSVQMYYQTKDGNDSLVMKAIRNKTAQNTYNIERFFIRNSGQYTIKVKAINNKSIGLYTLQLLTISDTDGGQLLSGTQNKGNIDFAGDTDQWTFNAKKDDLITITLQSDQQLNPYMTLNEKNDTFLTKATERLINQESKKVWILLIKDFKIKTSGEYTITAGAKGRYFGEYSVTILSRP
ncbi:MAG: hypothetical protein MK357_06710 [SAR202 cluster bacterium]|nr:hypothetical protein [SAR202 cluster bacterium]